MRVRESAFRFRHYRPTLNATANVAYLAFRAFAVSYSGIAIPPVLTRSMGEDRERGETQTGEHLVGRLGDTRGSKPGGR